MNGDHYVHLRPVGVDSSDAANSDEAIIAEGWWCKSCRSPKPDTEAIDFQILKEPPRNKLLDLVGGFGVSLARRSFLLLLGEEGITQNLMLGKVLGPSSDVIDDWVTVRGRHRLIVRGSIKKGFERYVGSRICGTCGNRTYSAYPPNYLYPRPRQDVAIYESDLRGLIVQPNLIEHINLKRRPGFGIEKLKVLDKPKDGLGDFADN